MNGHYFKHPRFLPPRGLREIAWTITATSMLVTTLVLPGGWYIALCVAVTTWLVGSTPRQLAAGGATALVTVIVATTCTGGIYAFPALVWHVITLGTVVSFSPIDLVAWALVETPFVMLTCALLLAMPNRKVNRGVVDERLWNRQQSRRRNTLRREARDNPPPLVVT